MAGALPIDPEEWDLIIDKLVRFHDNIQLEIKELINKIKQEMNGLGSTMVPIAEQKAEYAKEMGSFDTENMTVDFIEDMLIKSKPLQIVLLGIRRKQKDTLDELKKKYGDSIKDLEPLYIPRPPKPDHETLLMMKEGMSMKQASKKEAPKPEEAAAPAPEATELPAEPGPAIEEAAQQPAEVAA